MDYILNKWKEQAKDIIKQGRLKEKLCENNLLGEKIDIMVNSCISDFADELEREDDPYSVALLPGKARRIIKNLDKEIEQFLEEKKKSVKLIDLLKNLPSVKEKNYIIENEIQWAIINKELSETVRTELSMGKSIFV